MFLHFLLAHCVADFLLQPSALIALKNRSYVGIVIHAIIHMVTLALVFWPGLGTFPFWLSTIFIVVFHGLIDNLKIRFQHKRGRYIVPFFIDQILHISILIFSIMLFKPDPSLLWLSDRVAYGLLLILLLTIMYEIVRYEFSLEKTKQVVFRPSWFYMVLRGLLGLLIYSYFFIF